jgi:hypothetical protein
VSDRESTPANHTESVYLGGKHLRQDRLLRGSITEIKIKGNDVLAYVSTDRYPGREFRVYLKRKDKPFGSQRNVSVKKLDLPFITSPADLNLAVGTAVLFGFPNPPDDMVFQMEIKARDGDQPGLKKGHHRWTT